MALVALNRFVSLDEKVSRCLLGITGARFTAGGRRTPLKRSRQVAGVTKRHHPALQLAKQFQARHHHIAPFVEAREVVAVDRLPCQSYIIGGLL
jgi:hypothetical protein